MNFLDFITLQQTKTNIQEDNNKEISNRGNNKKEKDNKREHDKIREHDKKKDTKTEFKKTNAYSKTKNIETPSQSNESQKTHDTIKRPYFRKGDFVTIIRMENSNMNVYKGYYGEIYDYTKNSDYASVMIDCLNSIPIRIHVDHLIKRVY